MRRAGVARASSRLPWLAALLALVVLASFWPVLGAGFLNFDDDAAVLHNTHRLGFAPEQIRWAFTSFHLGNWQPLTWLSLSLDYALYGLQPAGFHATNLVLHCANAVLVLLLARALLALVWRRQTGPVTGDSALGAARQPTSTDLDLAACLAAVVFAVHPLRVESVAWITERRDVLAGLFYLTALLLAVRRSAAPTWRNFWPCLLALLLSLLCKAWAVTLPALLLLLDVYPLGRFARLRREPDPARARLARRRFWLEQVLLFVPALAAAVLAAKAQIDFGAARAWEGHGLLERAAQAAYGLCFYPWRTLWPMDLSPLYALGPRLDPLEPRFLAAAGVLLLAVPSLIALRRRAPWALAAALAFALTVAPVLGFMQSGPQLVADRYSYLACLSFAVLAGGGGLALARGRLLAGLAIALAVLLGSLTFAQARHWRDSTALWNRVLAVDPGSGFARLNLGQALFAENCFQEALPHLLRAAEDPPADRAGRVTVLAALGAVQARLGDLRSAQGQWEQVLRLDPFHIETLFNLGVAAEQNGQEAEAVQWFQRAVQACAATEVPLHVRATCAEARAALAGRGQ
ncbi:MAG: tetratricopeptide repeat protein [Planctomycetota bacterium]